MSKQADEELLETVGLMPGDDLSKGITITVTAETLKKWDSIITQRCLEARKDEYNHHLPCKRHGDHYTIAKADLDKRMAEIDSQLTNLQNKEEK